MTQRAPVASFVRALASAAHGVRAWSSADSTRLADVVTGGRRVLYLGRRDLWAWDSTSYTAYHLGPFPARFGRTTMPSATASPKACYASQCGPMVPDPEQLAAMALQAIDSTTMVTVGTPRRMAGRDAYVLVLTPRSADTLVGRVEISVDAARRVPLGVDVFARNATRPALSVDFTSVSFDPIKPSMFDF